MTNSPSSRLVVRRLVKASPERLFEAWTTPSQLLSWWGPRGVNCTAAEIDLRMGGRYRLANELPGGRIIVITGTFLGIDPPNELVYTWSVEPNARTPELVTVQFRLRETGTEVVVTHQRIPDTQTKQRHAEGWSGCLDGLAAYVRQKRMV